MQVSDLTNNKKMVMVESAVAVVLLLLGFYFVVLVKDDSDSNVSVSKASDQLLGPDFLVFLQAVSQDNLSLDVKSLFQKQLVTTAEDFTQIITASNIRGRSDPFIPFNGTR